MTMEQAYIDILEKGIDQLVNAFVESPQNFYSENDLHCELFYRLRRLGLNKSCKVRVGRRTVDSTIIHRDYPTKGRYKRNRNGPSLKVQRGLRGSLDLCIWDPDITRKRQFERIGEKDGQRTLAAVEINLNEDYRRFQWQVYWDLLKLSDPMNEIENRYILFFLRDYPYKRYNFPEDGFLKTLNEMFRRESKTKIIYAERKGDEAKVWIISNTEFYEYQKYSG